MNKLLLPLLSALALLASCSKEKVKPMPAPEPITELGFTRMFDYVGTNVLRDTAYFNQELRSQVVVDHDGLLLKLETASGKEHLSFRVRPNQLPSGLVGSFVLDNGNNVRTAETTYLYQLQRTSSGGAYSVLGNDISPTSGTFTISGYNTQRGLLSGSYNFQFTGVTDPTVSSQDPARRRCDVILAGAFKNIKLQSTR
jgi:hypothetical protein